MINVIRNNYKMNWAMKKSQNYRPWKKGISISDQNNEQRNKNVSDFYT